MFWSKDGSVAMFLEEGGEGGVHGVRGVNKVFVWLLESKDVKVGGGGKGNGTAGGVMKALVPCGNAEDGGMVISIGCGRERGKMFGRR